MQYAAISKYSQYPAMGLLKILLWQTIWGDKDYLFREIIFPIKFALSFFNLNIHRMYIFLPKVPMQQVLIKHSGFKNFKYHFNLKYYPSAIKPLECSSF